MFSGLLDPDPDLLVRTARIRILLSPSKNSKKNLDSYCFFVTSFWLFIFEKWCKCTFKRSGSESGSIGQSHGSAGPDLDPYQNIMDSQNWHSVTSNLIFFWTVYNIFERLLRGGGGSSIPDLSISLYRYVFRIRITLMRIRMRIRILLFILIGSGSSFPIWCGCGSGSSFPKWCRPGSATQSLIRRKETASTGSLKNINGLLTQQVLRKFFSNFGLFFSMFLP